MSNRRILHVDMDEFFAAVEKLDNPSLRGKPLLVAGDPQKRGVVSTASYEARKFGCHSAMPTSQALRLCPQGILLPIRAKRYREISNKVFAVFERFTPLMEPLSIDEAFLDVSGCERLLGPAEKIARDLRSTIRNELNLTASVGVAPNKFLAKIASDMDKPDGLTVITEQNIHEKLDPLPISRLWGMGPVAVKRFERFGIQTIFQLRTREVEELREWFGDTGEHFWNLSNGIDDRPVVPDSQAKSIGQEQTFAEDINDLDELRRVLNEQCEQVARRVRHAKLLARRITIKLRYGDFTTLTRSNTLSEPTDTTNEIMQQGNLLLDKWAVKSFQPLRLLGAALSQLVNPGAGGQMSLFEDADKKKHQRLDTTIDIITERFGTDAVKRGTSFGKNP